MPVASWTTEAEVPARLSFRGDVEGLRALAILLVIAFHVGLPGWTGGFVGVDIFFVISGYLITSLLTHELAQAGRISLLSFYARRARRLLPAAALTIVGTLAAAKILLSPLELQRLASTAKATAAYVSNFYFIGQAANYFAPDIKANPLLHTWSLAVEEQFYLFWPVLLALTFSWTRSKRPFLWICGAVTLLSFALWIWSSPPWAFFGSPARAWEFGLGALASFVPPGFLRRSTRGPVCLALGCAGLVAILAAAHRLDGSTAFSRALMLAPTLGTGAMLLAGAGAPDGWMTRILSAWPLRLIGQLSYSWYLWHWPILVLAKLKTPSITLSGRLLCALLALCLSALSYLVVERPVRTSRTLALRPVTSLVLAGMVTCATVGSAFVGHRVATEALRASAFRAIMDTVNEPSILNDRGCLYPTTELIECEFGAPQSSTTIVLFGDSLAGEWAPVLNTIATARGWRLVTLLKAACSPAEIPTPNSQMAECSEWRGKAIRRIVELRPRAVLVSSSRLYPSWFGYERWRDGFRRTVASFAAARIATVIIATTPMTRTDVPACVLRTMAHGGDARACGAARSVALDARKAQAERDAVSGLSPVRIVDFSDRFCDARTCPAMKDNVLVYLDGTHTSQAFARTLLPAMAEALDESIKVR